MRILTWNVNGIKTLLQYHPWNVRKTYEGILEVLDADIICVQETKITRAQMDKSMAVLDAFDSFFSFYRRTPPKGVHGTAIFTKRAVTVPIKAEEGIGGALVPSAVPSSERIGGYPMSDDLDLTYVEMKDLDLEGRTTVCDFGMFVLINLYCPNETNDQRLVFKNYFNVMVDQRVKNLIRAGREVIVVGDLNICHSPIDSCEADQRVKDQNLERFIDHPPRAWLNEFVGPNGSMIDITRKLHPTRASMYTCWNTKIDARPSNYGTRLDYILITPGLLPWVKDSNIQPEVVGSDHCPVYLDLHDSIEIEGRGTVHLWNEMNPGSMRGHPLPSPPTFAARNYNEFSGKQKLLSTFFGKNAVTATPTPSPSPGPSGTSQSSTSTSATASTSTSALTSATSSSKRSAATSEPAPKPMPSRTPSTTKSATSVTSSETRDIKGKGKQKVKEKDSVEKEKVTPKVVEKPAPGTQQSLSSFFKPPPKAAETIPKKKKKKEKPLESSTSTSTNALSTNSTSSSYKNTTPELEVEVDVEDGPPEDWDSSEYQVASAEQNAASAAAWSNLFAPKAVPNCSAHDEPSKLWTVNKPGINKGRRFYLCSRPVGPGYDKGQAKTFVDPQYRCDFFQWDTSVKRPSSIVLPSAAAKKKRLDLEKE